MRKQMKPKAKSNIVAHPLAAKRGRQLGAKLRGAKRSGRHGALVAATFVAGIASTIGAFAEGFWKAA